MPRHTSLALFSLCLLTSVAGAQKKPLDHSVYDSWNSIRSTSLSHDGKWILYVIAPQEGDSKVEIKSLVTDTVYTFPRGGAVQFSNDSHYVIATIVPPLADTKKATRDKVPPADAPKNALMILNLANGEQTKVERVTSFQLPAEDSGWFTYRPEAPKGETGTAGGTPTANPRPAAGGTRRAGAGAGARAGSAPAAATGSPLVIRELGSAKEEKLENVGDALLSKDGTTLAYTIISKDGKEDGVYWMNLPKHHKTEVLKGKAKTQKLALNDETKDLAVLTDRKLDAPEKAEKPKKESPTAKATEAKTGLTVYLFDSKLSKVRALVDDTHSVVPKGWIISENGGVSFSEKGNRIFFGMAPKPAEEKKDDTPDSEKVSVDVWTWKDKKIMPQQLLQAAADQKKTYLAMVTRDGSKAVQLESEKIPSVSVSQRGEGAYALGTSDNDYRLESSWDDGYSDYYVVDVATGAAREFLHRSEARPSFSPDGRYVAGFEFGTKQYFFFDPATLKRTDSNIPTVLYNQLTDTPSTPPAYGEAGWTNGDDRLLVYDEFDIWSIDPTGKKPAMSVTGGAGRLSNLRYRYLNTDPEARFVDLAKPILLSTFDPDTKAAGYSTEDALKPMARPRKLVYGNKTYSAPIFSKDGSAVTFTRQDFVEYPDVWVAKPDFKDAKKISNANPQQSQYNWGTAELVNWVSGDGQKLQGILIKPENFSYGKKYPMVTYFYERLSDTLNAYHPPAPSASTINLPYFASNGYVVFIPDIPYKTGYPGESSVSAIVSGVLNIVNRGYVDSKRLGIQGQSWGGYAVAYLVTRTNLFACACSGAAVSDMFSAYGGIRYGTGILREGQYEHGQSRIGGSPWDKPLRYLENSPLFWLDKVETPLLMMHNDKDGAVPFTQGIELLSGLRRLSKPAWMCVYNGEDHNLVERKNRKDWSVRMSQFFDHFLMDKPMPVWMSKGVPATMKGKTFGFELETGGK